MFRNPLMDAVIVLVIVLLFVGPKKLPALGKGLGQGMREFKEGITGESKHEDAPTLSETHATPQPQPQPSSTESVPRTGSGSTGPERPS